MSVTRFTSYDSDPDTGSLSVTDIVEIHDVVDTKKTRRAIMRELGMMVDQMLNGTYGINEFRVERN